MCAFRARRSQRSFPLYSLPVKGATRDACSPDEIENNTSNTNDDNNNSSNINYNSSTSSSNNSCSSQQQSPTRKQGKHFTQEPFTAHQIKCCPISHIFTAHPAVVVPSNDNSNDDNSTKQPAQSREEKHPSPIQPSKIQCFLDPVYFANSHEGMTKDAPQSTVKLTDLDEDENNNSSLFTSNNSAFARTTGSKLCAGQVNAAFEENELEEKGTTSPGKGRQSTNSLSQLAPCESKSIKHRLSQAGIFVNGDHVLVQKLPSSAFHCPINQGPTCHYTNRGYSGENFDDPTCDLFGPRFSRITLTDMDVDGKSKYQTEGGGRGGDENVQQPSSPATLPSVYSTGSNGASDAGTCTFDRSNGTPVHHQQHPLNDLKSKPQSKLNLQQRTIIQVASDHNNSNSNSNNAIVLHVKSTGGDQIDTFNCNCNSLNIFSSSNSSAKEANNMNKRTLDAKDRVGQEMEVERKISVCACIDEDVEGEERDSQHPSPPASLDHRHQQARGSPVESNHSQITKEMNGEGFKRWSRSKAATPLDAAYHPALAEISGRTFEPITLWTEAKRVNSISSSLKFNRSPASSICGSNGTGRRDSLVDTAGIKGLSYVRKPSVPKSSFLTPRTVRRLNLASGGGNSGGGGGGGRRGSVMQTIFGEVGDRRFSQDLRSPYDLSRRPNDFVNEKGETAKVIFFQVFIPFLVAGFGNVGAGLILDHVQFWPVFQASKELFILVASFLGFKGNLEMTLAARLATQANCGQLDSLLAQIQIGIGNVALIQAQATVVAFLAALIAICINYFKDFTFQFDSSLLIMTTSLVTAAITGLFLSLLMIIVTVFSRKIGINPDNVSTLLAAFLGDISAVILLAGSAKLFYDYRYITWLQPAVCIAFFIILPVFLFIARKNKYTHDVVGTGWFPIIIAMIISSIAGLIFDLAVDKYETIAVLQPIINGVGANLVAVQASRISTYFHQRATLGSMPVDDEGKLYRICQSPIDAFIGKSKFTLS